MENAFRLFLARASSIEIPGNLLALTESAAGIIEAGPSERFVTFQIAVQLYNTQNQSSSSGDC